MMLVPLLIAVMLLVAGVALAFVGLRGRRVSDHPHCRACGFDLFGSDPGAATCSECGADLSAGVRHGRRERRRGLLALGLALIVVGGTPLVLGGVAAVRQVDWQPLKPVWWLGMEAGAGGPTAEAALDELLRRLSAGLLAPSDIGGLVADGLAAQGDAARPWEPKWGELIEKARAAGQVSPAEWERYGRQAIAGGLWLEVRPRVARGDPIPAWLRHRGARVGESSSLAIRIDEQVDVVGPVSDSHRGSGGFGASPTSGGGLGHSMRPSAEEWSQVAEGPQELEHRVRVRVTEGWGDNAAVVATEQMTLKAGFEVVPADKPTVAFVTDPALRPAVEAALRPQELVMQANQVSSTIHVDSASVGRAFNVVARRGDREWPLGSINAAPGKSTGYSIHGEMEGFEGDRVDLVLRPSLEVAKGTTDVFEVWGEEVVLKDVPVKRVP